MPTTRAVILARGLGTRMRKADDAAAIDPAQAAAADTGVKGMIPIGRPFLDYLISALADAGYTDVCLVIGPDHAVVREHYERLVPRRVRIAFAIQELPLGTADAVLAVEDFADGEPFVAINSDNYYPVAALAELQRRNSPALIAFQRRALVTLGNVPADRVSRFGALEINADGYLEGIIATPAGTQGNEAEMYASLNCWLFTPEIFRACRTVGKSARGELELPQAVQLAIREGWMRFEAVRVSAGVLDMSSRGDIASVAARLRDVAVLV